MPRKAYPLAGPLFLIITQDASHCWGRQLGLRKPQLAGYGRPHSNRQPIQLPENRDAAGGLSPRHSCPLFAAAAWNFRKPPV